MIMSGVQQSPIYYQCTGFGRLPQCQTIPVHRGARRFVEEKVDKRCLECRTIPKRVPNHESFLCQINHDKLIIKNV